MKKLYLLLLVFVSLPSLVFASNPDVEVEKGVKIMSAQGNCL